ncbi:hypothetical protein SBV1_1260010 [Verrucomicrobia bacterium]|nr:hypothetical protein SBV1_1260010 [Verrucomicrobiota bacterium]
MTPTAIRGANCDGPELGKAGPPLNVAKVLQAPADAAITWEALRGKVVVIDFWATWCGGCRKSIPHWNELVGSFKGKPVQFVAITDENEQVVAQFLKRTPIQSWVGVDGVGRPSADPYHIVGVPTVVLVNQEGLVVAVTGPAQLEPQHIQEVVQTGRSSLPPPSEPVAAQPKDPEERVQVANPDFEISVRRSRLLPAGHGFDCCTKISDTNRYDIRLKWKMSEGELKNDGEVGPDPNAIIIAVREQLGLNLTLECRSMPVLIVEKPGATA